MKKERKYFLIIMCLFFFVILSNSMLSPDSTAAKFINYGYFFIFICYWLWSAFFVAKGNAGFLKKIKSHKDEKES